MSNVVDIVKALVSPAEKLIDAVQGAIGKIYEPHYTKKMAIAEAKGISLISQAIRENGDMSIIYKSDKLTIKNKYVKHYLQNIQDVNMAQAIRKQITKESIADLAYDILSENPDIKVSNDIDRDWINKFFEYAQDITDEDLKILWARILAGEIRQSGSVSRRTLSILYNLSKKEALIFENICGYAYKLGNSYQVPNIFNPELGFYMKPEDMLTMEECGLVHSLTNLDKTAKLIQGEFFFASNGEIAIYAQSQRKNKQEETLNIKGFQFTSSGNELVPIIGKVMSNDHLLSFAAIMKRDLNGVLLIKAYRLKSMENGETQWDKSHDLLE